MGIIFTNAAIGNGTPITDGAAITFTGGAGNLEFNRKYVIRIWY